MLPDYARNGPWHSPVSSIVSWLKKGFFLSFFAEKLRVLWCLKNISKAGIFYIDKVGGFTTPNWLSD